MNDVNKIDFSKFTTLKTLAFTGPKQYCNLLMYCLWNVNTLKNVIVDPKQVSSANALLIMRGRSKKMKNFIICDFFMLESAEMKKLLTQEKFNFVPNLERICLYDLDSIAPRQSNYIFTGLRLWSSTDLRI